MFTIGDIMNKERFCEIGQKIDKYLDQCSSFSDAMNLFCDGSCVCYPGEFILDELTDMVGDIMGDDDELFTVFLYERPLKFTVEDNDEEIVVSTYGELYDFIKSEK